MHAIIACACIVVFALLLGIVPQDPLKLVAFGLLGATMLAVMGVLGGIWADRFDNIAVVTNFVITPLTFLSGTFYSIEQLPEAWHAVAVFNPFFHMIDGFRSGMTGVGEVSTGLSLTVLLVTNFILKELQ